MSGIHLSSIHLSGQSILKPPDDQAMMLKDMKCSRHIANQHESLELTKVIGYLIRTQIRMMTFLVRYQSGPPLGVSDAETHEVLCLVVGVTFPNRQRMADRGAMFDLISRREVTNAEMVSTQSH